MHNSFYFIRQLAPAIEKQLNGSVLKTCFSQNKDELILEFFTNKSLNFYIKAYLKNHFSCLSFPNKYHRAKRNSINLFGSIIGKKITGLQTYNNERAFSLEFGNATLLFKLYGNQSNILLFKDEDIVELFKNNLKRDSLIKINELNRELDISYQNLYENDWNVRKVIPTLEKQSAQILLSKISDMSNTNGEIAFNNFFTDLNSSHFYLINQATGYKLSLLRAIDFVEEFTDPLVAITSFFEKEVKRNSLSIVKSKIQSDLNGQLIKADNYVRKIKEKLEELSKKSSNKQKGDLLMANLHKVAKRAKSITLPNFYDDTEITVKLNPDFSPQKNAERYYRKAKNEAKEIATLTANIKDKGALILKLKTNLSEIEKSDNIKLLQKWKPRHQKSNPEVVLPYKEYFMDGYRILVGKNAKHNDTLTLKIAKKDDLWLHAKDVSGSHVVIKQIPGRNFPEYIIEKAAQLAAFYSKRKTDSLCPVLYTPKKYVRKKKGTPFGVVFVEKEKVVLVEPSSLAIP
jgi:predicted ribosome quality control (RQC) complex YloA/Tae2 family protein